MKLIEQRPPRVFRTGRSAPIDMSDVARIELVADEQVTFVTEAGGEYDVARKSWGFYATPSLNGRLGQFGLRAALVRSAIGKFYVFLIEAGKEDDCRKYLEAEDNVLVRWLDNAQDLEALVAQDRAACVGPPDLHCMCGISRFTTAHMYFGPPAGELSLGDVPVYRRELFQCSVCRHYVSMHRMTTPGFYDGVYVDATYGGLDGMRRQFDRIRQLPPEKSDNTGRVASVLAFAAATGRGRSTVLDVGSGLGIFPYAMTEAGWPVTALDPDARAVDHLRDALGVTAIRADFLKAELPGRYDVITFNKVLEHVKDPVRMLERADRLLEKGGFVYVEVPDGESAALDPDGFGREEFFIEHYHVFSAASAALLVARAGLDVLALERLREPSGKYTLRVFAGRPHQP